MKENEKMKSINLTEKNELEKKQKNIIEKDKVNPSENNIEDEEFLGYKMLYKPISVDYNQKNQNNQNLLRKTSTISTTLSENGLDIFSPKKCDINSNDDIENSSKIFFCRNRFYSTPISDYLDETDNYLKGLNPEKNDYQKSNNYLKKEKFFSREHFSSVDLINSNSKEIKENNIYSKTCPKLTIDINCQNPTEKSPLTQNNKNNTAIFTFQKNMNKNSVKFDFPIYDYGYYNLDCK